MAFTATIKAHSAAINATMASFENSNEENSKEFIQSSASRCEDLLQQMLLLRRDYGNDKTLKPTSVTYDLTLAVLNQAGDSDAVKRVQMLRNDEGNPIAVQPRFRGNRSKAKR